MACPLTREQLTVLEVLSEGVSYVEAGRRLVRSPSTIRTHVHNACRRLRVHTSAQAVIVCYRQGWLAFAGDEREPLAAAVRLLAVATDRLAAAVERRERLTGAQRNYLRAFDELLYARDDDSHIRARASMDRALVPVLEQAGVRPGSRSAYKRDMVELLAERAG